MDPGTEHGLQRQWNKKPIVPPLLDFFLPNDVHYIGHQLASSESSTAVKLAHGDVIMARASYEYKDRTFPL